MQLKVKAPPPVKLTPSEGAERSVAVEPWWFACVARRSVATMPTAYHGFCLPAATAAATPTSTTTKQTREFKMHGLCANYSDVVSEISDRSRPKLSQLSDAALVPM